MRKVFLPVILVLALSACKTWNPDFMPAGYTYHSEEYKSPPGPEAPSLGYEYSAEENEKYLMMWRYALRDMMMKTKAEGVVLPQTLNLVSDLDENAFSASYDYILREGLRAYGHTLSEGDDVPKVFYSAYLPGTDDHYVSKDWPEYNQEEGFDENEAFVKFKHKVQEMDLVLGSIEDGQLAKNVRGRYELPVHSFTPGAYVAGYKNPLKQSQMPGFPLFEEHEDE